jgi:hypothetical protein
MTAPDEAALFQILAVCHTHRDALREALNDIGERQFTQSDIENLTKVDRRLLDQFAYRYTRLQDDLGARLLPAALKALSEEVSTMPAIDRFNRLEQLGWLPSADEWLELRQIRNQFAHEYPETPDQRFERFQAAARAATRLLDILSGFSEKIENRFPAYQEKIQ